jgi:hypothetical protein
MKVMSSNQLEDTGYPSPEKQPKRMGELLTSVGQVFFEGLKN